MSALSSIMTFLVLLRLWSIDVDVPLEPEEQVFHIVFSILKKDLTFLKWLKKSKEVSFGMKERNRLEIVLSLDKFLIRLFRVSWMRSIIFLSENPHIFPCKEELIMLSKSSKTQDFLLGRILSIWQSNSKIFLTILFT
jgi:hypothetical protein